MASRKSHLKADDLKQEDILQAVVIADSFNVRFLPLTHDRPRALLPLVNVPLLEYTLEFLLAADVQYVIIFCCAHADKVKSYIHTSKWASPAVGMEVCIIVSDSCMSLGDALRDLEAKSIIRSDFVLVHGDLVANLKLAAIFEAHKQRRASVKGAVMTLLYKEAPPKHATRRTEDEFIVALNSQSKRVIAYHRVKNLKNKFVLNRESFEACSSVQIRHDLLDCHISICSPAVLQLMADNFDFETIDDLIKGILVNEEVQDVSVYAHTVKPMEYAACAADPVAYAAVSQDVLSRWVYPFVPDRNVTGLVEDAYVYRLHSVYLHRDITLQRGLALDENVIIGCGSVVGEHSSISRSVIGKRCRIGKMVVIVGSYLMDGVTVEDCCTVTDCIVDRGVVIGSSSSVTGAIFGTNVKLPSHSKLLEGGKKLTMETDFVAEGVTVEKFDPVNGIHQCLYSETSSSKLWNTWGTSNHVTDAEYETSTSESESEDETGEPQQTEEMLLSDEMATTLDRAMNEAVSVENVIVEINSIKHAYGIQIKELNKLLMKTLLTLPLRSPGNTGQYFSQFKANAVWFLSLLKNYFRSRDSQTDALIAIEEASLSNGVILSNVAKVVHLLYDEELDVLSEQVILDWWSQLTDIAVHKNMEKFIQWLNTADEEDSDDD